MRASTRRKPRIVSITPQPTLPPGLDSANVFRDKFGDLDDERWFDILVESLHAAVIDEVQFPRYPDAELQNRIHGYANQHALHEAFDFYLFIKSHDYLRRKLTRESYFLDFAAGWGRMSRPFLRHFDLNRIFSYEPNMAFCVVARKLNPYICFLNGDYYPDNTLPHDRFDLVIGYSIFTHLSPELATLWLDEMARITRPDAYCVFTTWGERFFARLQGERANLALGKEIHWYSRACLAAAGDLDALIARYRDGEFAWVSLNPGSPYGEAFLPPRALAMLLEANALPLELVEFDQDNLAQDAFILRRREATAIRLVHPPRPANIEELARDGWAALERHDWDKASELWETVRTRAPDRADGYIVGSHALRGLGRLDEAEALSAEAVARFPDSPDALAAFAWVAMTREDWAEAARRWATLQRAFPEREDCHVFAARALRGAKLFEEADALAREAATRFPASTAALAERILIAAERDDWDAASALLAASRDRLVSDGRLDPALSWVDERLRTAPLPDPGSTAPRSTAPAAVAGRESFCIRPWTNFRMEANGAGRICCLFEGDTVAEGGTLMSSAKHSLMAMWNSESMRQVRRDMVEGRRIAGCRQCYAVEERGGLSTRVQDNQRWEAGWLNPAGATIGEVAAQAVGADFRLPMPPVQLEIEIGNLCNFKCRMCHGTASSRIGKDAVQQSWARDGFSSVHHDPRAQPVPYRFHRASFVEKLAAEVAADSEGRIQRLYFTGGEPLLVREVDRALEALVAAGRAADLDLAFVSNGSVLPRWAALARHFRRVDLTISVDGFGAHYEYIRYPGRWTVLTEHLKALRHYPDIELSVSTTVQVNNALHLTRLFRHLDSLSIPYSAYLLHWPKYLSIEALPRQIRCVAAQRLREYAAGDCPVWRRELVASLAAELAGDDSAADPVLLRDFMLFTNDLDASRGQDIRRADPELVELLAQAGFPWIDDRLHAAAVP